MWGCHRMQFAKTTITIIIATLMGAGFFIERLNGTLVATPLKLGTYAIKFSEHLEENFTKLHTFSAEKIIKNVVNIPEQILDNEYNKYKYSSNCSRLPKALDIVLESKYWQRYNSSKGLPLYLYSAHYDKRKILNGNAVIRIIATKNHEHYNEEYYCKIWYIRNNEIKTILTLLVIHKIKSSEKPMKFNTYFLNCNIPTSHINEVIFAVSVTKSECEKVTNILRVNIQKAKGTKKDFAVCIKGLEFPFDDKSIFLVEWLELLKILKVDKVFMYELIVHPNMSKTLEHYRDEGFIDIMPLSLPGAQPNSPDEMHKYLYSDMDLKRAQEKLPYNDCFYRNMNNYKFLAIQDLDEIMIPVKFHTWKELFGDLETTQKELNPAAYTFRRFTSTENMIEPHGYSPRIPEYMYMSQHVYHSKRPARFKSVVSTDSVYAIDNHYPMLCFNGDSNNAGDVNGFGDNSIGIDENGVMASWASLGKCRLNRVPREDASILHFWGSCKKHRDRWCKLNDSIQDTNIWKYKDELIRRTTKKIKLLNLL